jgi:hypothetical protein
MIFRNVAADTFFRAFPVRRAAQIALTRIKPTDTNLKEAELGREIENVGRQF